LSVLISDLLSGIKIRIIKHAQNLVQIDVNQNVAETLFLSKRRRDNESRILMFANLFKRRMELSAAVIIRRAEIRGGGVSKCM
jgi:hypothetical protein